MNLVVSETLVVERLLRSSKELNFAWLRSTAHHSCSFLARANREQLIHSAQDF